MASMASIRGYTYCLGYMEKSMRGMPWSMMAECTAEAVCWGSDATMDECSQARCAKYTVDEVCNAHARRSPARLLRLEPAWNESCSLSGPEAPT